MFTNLWYLTLMILQTPLTWSRLSLAWNITVQYSRRLVKSRFNWIITYTTDTWRWAWWRTQYSAMCKGNTGTVYSRVPQGLRPVSTFFNQGGSGAGSEPKNWFLVRKTGSRTKPSLLIFVPNDAGKFENVYSDTTVALMPVEKQTGFLKVHGLNKLLNQH